VQNECNRLLKAPYITCYKNLLALHNTL